MASRFQNGMQGVFLTASELTHRGFVVSLTARNAFGADLPVTDNQCQHAWSVQVKTNQDTASNFWLLNAHSENLKSDSHVYVFVALRGNQRPKFLVVPSCIVAENVWKDRPKAVSGIRSAAIRNGITRTKGGRKVSEALAKSPTQRTLPHLRPSRKNSNRRVTSVSGLAVNAEFRHYSPPFQNRSTEPCDR